MIHRAGSHAFWMRVLVPGILILLTACGGGDSSTGPMPMAAPSGLSYPSPQAFVVGSAIATLSPTVNGTVSAYTVSPALPAGLALNATSGQITGTPTTATASANYAIRAENASGATTFTLSIAVNAAPEMQLEPTNGTSIGVNQVINLHVAYKRQTSDPYPSYVDATTVTWSSSQPSIASVGTDGAVRGLAEGSTVITAQYQSLSRQIPVAVGGTYVTRTVATPGQGNRAYSVLRPSGVAAGTALPVLLAIHGGGGTARIHASTTLLSSLGQQRKILIAYLEGTGAIQTFNAGNCCGSAQTNSVDDVTYVNAVLDDLAARDTVDAARVYSSGFSNGGMMSHRLACVMADRIAGIAAVGGASGQFDRGGNSLYSCMPTRPIPILHVHAMNDRNYPYAGGFGAGLSNTDFYPVDATISDWITRNNVTTQGSVEQVTPTTRCTRYATRADALRPSAAVTLCKVDPPDVYDAANSIVFGGGHSWPGGNRSVSASGDSPVHDFDANSYLWTFFGN
jgi:polyhydroxybutyrate depolymerase